MLRAVLSVGIAVSAGLLAQDAQAPASSPSTEPRSRAEEIQLQREQKARNLSPEVTSGTERFLVEIKERKILEKITYGIGGLRLKIGSLVTGSGFALGPEYFRDDLNDGRTLFRASAVGSTRQYYMLETLLSFHSLANDRMFVDLHASHRNFPQMQYYGPGPDSARTGRSNYRLEDTTYGFAAGVKPVRRMRMGVLGNVLNVNVGPGTDPRFISTERIYGPRLAPGVDVQTDYLRGGGFAQYDYRDIPGGARAGGNYVASFIYNMDRDLQRHTHRRLELEAQQFIPLFNARRVIALRGRSHLTYANPGQNVPFYMQPSLGGSDDLRGFRQFRFYGNNSLVFNAEYRYEIFSGLDMAVFGDAGKVFDRRSQLNFKDLEASYGIGMRFNARNAVFMRIDAGFSHEGFMVWVKFNNVF